MAAETLPVNFDVPSENIISTYNWTDIANGAGYATFYGSDFLDSTETKVYSLITSTIEAYTGITETAHNTDNTYNFDIAFNSPRTLKGDCFIGVPIRADGEGSSTIAITMNASLYHYDGSTETQIGGTITLALTSGAGTANWAYLNGVFEPSSQVQFKIGEILRLKLNLVNAASGNVTSTGAFAHNPTNWDTTYASEAGYRHMILKLDVPFKIET